MLCSAQLPQLFENRKLYNSKKLNRNANVFRISDKNGMELRVTRVRVRIQIVVNSLFGHFGHSSFTHAMEILIK